MSLSPDKLRETANARLSGITVPETPARPPKDLLHELQVHQIELEMQNEALRQSQVALEESRDRYVDLYDFAPVGYCTLSARGLILEANLTAAALLGTTRSALVNQPLSRHILKEDQDIYYLHHKKLFATGEAQNCDLRLVRPDGACSFRWVHLTGNAAQADEGAPVARITFSDITERKQLEIAREAARSHLQATLDALPDLLFEVDAEGRIFSYHTHRSDLLAAPPEVFIGKWIADVLPSDAASACQRAIDEAAQNGLSYGETYRLALPQGEHWFELSVAVFHVAAKSGQRFIIISRDITERKQAEAELRIAAIAFESQLGIIITDPKGVITRTNRAFTRLTGYKAAEAIGRTPAMLQSGRHDKVFYQRMWLEMKRKGRWQGEVWNRRKNGKIYAEWLSIAAVTAPDGTITHYVGAFSDITVNKEAEAEIHRLAYYDPLTLLPNRRLLLDRLGQAVTGSRRSGHPGALLFMDLDDFKTLNDTRGHDVGDQLLIEAARRIQAGLRESDTLARLGGDEFVILLEDLSEEAEEAAVQARQVGEKIRTALADPYDFDGYEYRGTVSIGIGLFPTPGEPLETLFKHADFAMYQAKTAGRNALCFFDPAMQSSLERRSAMEADLRLAVERGQLVLHYQMQVDGFRRVIGAEALLRWVHPVHGCVPPADFIPLAEETGLILPIGHWVLETACARIKGWSAMPAVRDLRVSVNVSARQFRQPDFVAQVEEVLARTGADPSRLQIELTESLVLDKVEETIVKISALKQAGVGFSLDDFGTGYSSLAYLTRLPLDQLKIDKSFVLKLPDSASDAIVARTIISMAQSLGLDVIAEGVETEAQRAFLERHHCRAYQGYLFSRPLPADEFEYFMTSSG